MGIQFLARLRHKRLELEELALLKHNWPAESRALSQLALLEHNWPAESLA